MNEKKIWKVRIRKVYPEATNHIAVGEVIEENPSYVKMRCRTYHFKKLLTPQSKFVTSQIKVRIFPWETIAYATELPSSLHWEKAEVELMEDGDLLLKGKEKKEDVGIKGGPSWLED
ncbi:MAG: hypothetical protein GXO71_04815 [Caldiserica bacterium]|nr:hypothetical protein [Caldisericota bacterium]